MTRTVTVPLWLLLVIAACTLVQLIALTMSMVTS